MRKLFVSFAGLILLSGLAVAQPPAPESTSEAPSVIQGQAQEDPSMEATPQEQLGRRGGRKRAHRQRGQRGGRGLGKLLSRIDSNGDGQLDDSEVAQLRQMLAQLRQRLDRNGDGKIDDSERQQIRQHMHRRRQQGTGSQQDQMG